MTSPTQNPIALTPSTKPSSSPSSSFPPAQQAPPVHPRPDIRPFDRLSYETTSEDSIDTSKRTYRTVRVLHIKESEVIAVEEGEEGSIVRLRWSEVLPPF